MAIHKFNTILLAYRLVEKNTDAFLESNEKSKKKQEEVEETVNNRKLNGNSRNLLCIALSDPQLVCHII